MRYVLLLLAMILWLYILHVLTRAKLNFWRFIVGSMGMFVLMMVGLQPLLTEPLARCVSALAGVVGTLTDTFTTYFKYAIIFIDMAGSSMTLKIDLECSGIIEIMAYISLLSFFNVYELREKLIVGVVGTAYLVVCNAARIAIICLSLHFVGPEVYYVMHTFVGRIFFYVMSILLYFYVFTKKQVQRIKVGNFTYEGA